MNPFFKKGLSALCVFALLSLLLAGCQKSVEPEPSEEISIYDRGLEVVSLLAEMAASEEYVDSFSSSESIGSLLQKTGSGDFSGPNLVYRIKISESALMKQTDIGLNDLSPALRENLKSRLNSAVVSQINAMGGGEVLAAASICTAGKTFVSTELEENVIYLYTYRYAAPVAVTFTKGEDNTVSATGSFVLYDAFREDPEAVLTDLLTIYGVQIEEIAP